MVIRYLNHSWYNDMYKTEKIVNLLVETMNLETAVMYFGIVIGG